MYAEPTDKYELLRLVKNLLSRATSLSLGSASLLLPRGSASLKDLSEFAWPGVANRRSADHGLLPARGCVHPDVAIELCATLLLPDCWLVLSIRATLPPMERPIFSLRSIFFSLRPKIRPALILYRSDTTQWINLFLNGTLGRRCCRRELINVNRLSGNWPFTAHTAASTCSTKSACQNVPVYSRTVSPPETRYTNEKILTGIYGYPDR
jgi:hypothetical protein